MRWRLTWRADPAVAALADRHYSRQKPGSAQFTPPGKVVVLVTAKADAAWATSWPKAEFVKHAWRGCWINSLFRNEGSAYCSELILEAVAATRWIWRDVPEDGLVTMVDPKYVPPVRRRGMGAIYGYSYLKAGFRHVGFTKAGQWVWGLERARMPPAAAPLGAQGALLDEAQTVG